MIRATCLAALSCAACVAQGATLTLNQLEIRDNAGAGNAFIAGVGDGVVATVPDGAGTTVRSSNVEWTTQLDGIGVDDDVISFTVTATSNTAENVNWSGLGWDNPLNDDDSVTFTVSGVSITAGSAAGAPISFDGFTAATAGVYAGGGTSEFDGKLDINGVEVAQVWPVSGAFDYTNLLATFPLASSVTYDNPQITTSVGFSGFSARGLTMQFTTIPEPTSIAVVGFAGLGLASRRR